jgi:hypothetical protein
MPFEAVHPRLQAPRAAALALVNEPVGAAGEAWPRWAAATGRIGKARDEVRAPAGVAGGKTEPTDAQRPPDPAAVGSSGDGGFAPGRFRYKRGGYDLGGPRLALLEAFVKARPRARTPDESSRACSKSYGAHRPSAHVSAWDAALCQLLGLRDKPIKRISGERAYRLHPPA